MLQILQNLRSGGQIAEVPAPTVKRGRLLIQTTASLVSAGTERMRLISVGRVHREGAAAARQGADGARQNRTDGLMPTIDAVRSKLDQPLPMGYSNVELVRAIGPGVPEGIFMLGDRVVSNGKHAELVAVPVNLCARIPNEVSDEAATFTVLGSIALQGIRLAQPTLGECFTVTGLGLIGLMTVQLLRAQGCRVLAIDVDSSVNSPGFGADTVDLSRARIRWLRRTVFSQARWTVCLLPPPQE